MGLNPDEPRNRLDVVRVREQVECAQRIQLIAGGSQRSGVTSKRDRVTRDINQLGWAELHQVTDDFAAGTGASSRSAARSIHGRVPSP